MSTAIAVTAGTESVQVGGPGIDVIGIAARETAGAVATLALRDGTTTAGPVIFVANLEAAGWLFAPVSVTTDTGLFLDRQTGTTELVIYARDGR